MFEDLYKKLEVQYLAKHQAAYPSLPINYPSVRTYVPNTDDPFVILGYIVKPRQMELGARSVYVDGDLHVTYHYKPGAGTQQAALFADFLLDKISFRTLDGIVFREVTPYASAAREGWEGVLHIIPFSTQYFNV